jgi:hypothetical protein
MGAVALREERDGRSGHTLKRSRSPGEAEAGVHRTHGGSGGTETLGSPPARAKAEEGSPDQQGDTSSVLNLWRMRQPHERRPPRGDAARQPETHQGFEGGTVRALQKSPLRRRRRGDRETIVAQARKPQEGRPSPRRRPGPPRGTLRGAERVVTPVIARTSPRKEEAGSGFHRDGRGTLEGAKPRGGSGPRGG